MKKLSSVLILTVTLAAGITGCQPPVIITSPQKIIPSCHFVEFPWSAGYIAVQENSQHRIQWGVVMTPMTLSIGDWTILVSLNGVEIDSKEKTYATPYVPHASYYKNFPVPSGEVFSVTAEVISGGIAYASVPNACKTM
jgi:hypothetical protein